MTACWSCGAEPRWQCGRCGSFERRTTSTGCAACHREASRRRKAEDRDIVVTPAIRAYLAAFDAYLKDSPGAERARESALNDLLEGK